MADRVRQLESCRWSNCYLLTTLYTKSAFLIFKAEISPNIISLFLLDNYLKVLYLNQRRRNADEMRTKCGRILQ